MSFLKSRSSPRPICSDSGRPCLSEGHERLTAFRPTCSFSSEQRHSMHRDSRIWQASVQPRMRCPKGRTDPRPSASPHSLLGRARGVNGSNACLMVSCHVWRATMKHEATPPASGSGIAASVQHLLPACAAHDGFVGSEERTGIRVARPSSMVASNCIPTTGALLCWSATCQVHPKRRCKQWLRRGREASEPLSGCMSPHGPH